MACGVGGYVFTLWSVSIQRLRGEHDLRDDGVGWAAAGGGQAGFRQCFHWGILGWQLKLLPLLADLGYPKGGVTLRRGRRRVQFIGLRSRSDSIESHFRASKILPLSYDNRFESLGGVRVCDAVCVGTERAAECAGDYRAA